MAVPHEPETPEHLEVEPADGSAPARRDPNAMTFLEHLEEFRLAVIRAVGVLVICTALVAFFLADVFHILNEPFYLGMGDRADDARMVTMTPLSVLSLVMQMCLFGGLSLALPFLVLIAGSFIAPALTAKERRMLLPFCLGAVMLFLLGLAFSFFIVVPGTIRLSAQLNRMLGLEMFWSWDSYYSLLVWMSLILGLSFEFPLVLMILLRLGVVSVAGLRAARAYVIVGCFVAAAIITPTPDPVTQSVVAVPLWLLYEGSLILGRWVERRADAV